MDRKRYPELCRRKKVVSNLNSQSLREEREPKLRALADELRQIKPEGWSIVFGKDEVVARPKDRAIGKFSIVYLRHNIFTVGFFSRGLNIWNKRHDFAEGPNIASLIRDWMSGAIADPKKRVGN